MHGKYFYHSWNGRIISHCSTSLWAWAQLTVFELFLWILQICCRRRGQWLAGPPPNLAPVKFLPRQLTHVSWILIFSIWMIEAIFCMLYCCLQWLPLLPLLQYLQERLQRPVKEMQITGKDDFGQAHVHTEMPRPPPDLPTRANPGPALTLPAIMTTHPWWAQMEFWQFSGNRRSSGKISLTIIDMASVTCFVPLKNQKNHNYYHHISIWVSSVLNKGLKGSFILIHVWFQNPC